MFSFLKKKSLVTRAALVGAVLVLLTTFFFVSCEQHGGFCKDNPEQPEPSGAATFKSLSVGAGTLSPAFSPSCFEYRITVRNAVNSVTVTAVSNSSKAVVSGAGTKTLNEGSNTVTIGVTAENGDSKTYTITVKRLDVSVIEIETADDMAKIGVEENWSLAASYFLMNDITLENWKPIIGSDNETPFSGVFDGNNQTITLNSFNNNFTGAYAYNNGTKYTNVFMGIFGAVKGVSSSAKAEIKDLKINSSVNVTSANQIADSGVGVGLLAGYAELAIFDNITLSGNFNYKYGGNNGSAYLGGITGFIIGGGTVIKNCNSSMAMDIQPGYGKAQIVPGNANAFSFVGGFVGFFKDGGAIENCHNIGAVSGQSDASGSQVMVGGIIGGSHYSFASDPHGYVADCSSTGDITVSAMGFWPMAGGIAGLFAGGTQTVEGSTHIVRCFASGTILNNSTSNTNWPYLGGIVGYIYVGAKVSQCYFTGTVINEKGNDYTGGIAGYNSYATGFNAANNNPGLIEDCWSSGVVRGRNNGGGIVGQNQANTLLKRSYSLMDVSVNNGGTSSAAQWGIGGIVGSHSSALDKAMEACVALNSRIYTPKGDEIHRIGGRIQGSPIMTNVYALPNLLPVTADTEKTYTADKGADRPDGADIPNNYLSGGKPTQAFFESIGWDFTNVWKMGSDGYPKLKWQG
jgi:hypothetical protein